MGRSRANDAERHDRATRERYLIPLVPVQSTFLEPILKRLHCCDFTQDHRHRQLAFAATLISRFTTVPLKSREAP
jgi:hypothetical protein